MKGRDIERYFLFPRVEQHWPISRLGKWRQDPSVRELLCLPNESPLSLIEPRVAALIGTVKDKYQEPKFNKYRAAVDEQFTKIRSLFNETTPMTELARQLDRLIADQINEGDANERCSASSGGSQNSPMRRAQPRRYAIPASTATRCISPRVSTTAASRS